MKRRSFVATTLGAVAFIMSAASHSLGFVGGAVADIYSKVRPRRPSMILPPVPKWNEATDDIDSMDYARLVEDFQRSLLPRDIIFPRSGELWEAVRDCEVYLMVWPFNGAVPGGKARLRQGEKVRILTLNDPKPLQIRFQPVRYHELRGTIVPSEIPGSWHYELLLRLARTGCALPGEEPGYFHELFRLVPDVG